MAASADKGKLAEVTHLTMRHLTLSPAIPGGDGTSHRIPIQPPEKCIRVGAPILTESADVGMLPQIQRQQRQIRGRGQIVSLCGHQPQTGDMGSAFRT